MTTPRGRTPALLELWLGWAAAALAQQNPDDGQRHLLAQARSASPDDYAFTRTIRADQTSGGKTEYRVTVQSFDPSKPADERWTVVSVDGVPKANRFSSNRSPTSPAPC